MLEDVAVLLFSALVLGSIAMLTVIPWAIGLAWMAHHWFGV
jgi:hypothetical protein